jgi:LmbE family N-acetylglucosaminyl deacetylase
MNCHHLRPDVAALGRIVTVWAHPDDESYLAGGLMALARCLGQPVTCVTATNGDAAACEPERERLGRLRRLELTAALRRLGVQDQVLLGLPDGGCATVPDELAIERIGAVLRERRPDTIVTFGPDGFTGHADHRAVSRWTVAAAARTCPTARILFPAVTASMLAHDRDVHDRFDLFGPGLPTVVAPDDVSVGLRLSGRWLDVKVQALLAHTSQTTGLVEALGVERFRRWVAVEPFVAGPTARRGTVDPLRPARPVHHPRPEGDVHSPSTARRSMSGSAR